MRVLALSSWWPEPADNGSRMRIAHLLHALAQEHEVHLVALSQGEVQADQRAQLETVCASARSIPERTWVPRRAETIASLWHSEPTSIRATWNPAFAALLRERAAAVRPDLLIAFQYAAAAYAHLVADVPRVLEELEVTVLFEQFARERNPGRRLRAYLTWHKHRSYLLRLLRNFDACTVVSEREQAQVRRFAPHGMPIAVIPNGADVDGCRGPWGEPKPDMLIYAGALTYDANLDAVVYFLSTILPLLRKSRPNVQLRVTGKADAAQRDLLSAFDGVEFTGYVPDIRPVVARAWAEVVPLRKGGGTRLKVLEALALGTPVVSTSKGVEGLNLEDGQHILIGDTPGAFAAATIRLLSQPDLRARLSAAGRDVVRAHYDWRTIGQQLNAVIREVVPAGD